jgi:hypothetical protein
LFCSDTKDDYLKGNVHIKGIQTMAFLRLFSIFLILYLVFKSIKNIFSSNTRKSERLKKKKPESDAGYFRTITDQKIEDAEYEDIRIEKDK